MNYPPWEWWLGLSVFAIGAAFLAYTVLRRPSAADSSGDCRHERLNLLHVYRDGTLKGKTLWCPDCAHGFHDLFKIATDARLPDIRL